MMLLNRKLTRALRVLVTRLKACWKDVVGAKLIPAALKVTGMTTSLQDGWRFVTGPIVGEQIEKEMRMVIKTRLFKS